MADLKIGINSVFIAKENILFLEEWIDYHIQVGFDRFYLYDNSKVQKKNEFNKNKRHMLPGKINKHGINFDALVKLTDADINDILHKIEQKYAGSVFFVEWSPTDCDGFICHQQEGAHNNCRSLLKNSDIEWCAVIDMDEFIVVDKKYNYNIKNFIRAQKPDVSCVILSQILFDTRFNNLDRLICHIDKTHIKLLPVDHSNKYIYRVKDAQKLSIHDCIVEGRSVRPSIDTVWFNHYKVDFCKKSQEFKIVVPNICPNILQRLIENSKTYIVCMYKT